MTLTDSDIHTARILIVDDQEANVRLLTRLLGDAGYTDVSSTMDPQAVCALHRHNDYDLILLDLQLPGMDGFAVMAALQAGAANSYLPVIVLTAQPGHKLRALQAGAKDFISKPFDLLEVKTRIRNMLEVRLLYRRLEAHNLLLEQTVAERTAELRESEARYRSLTELASDWYWEQDEHGSFTKVSGPVMDMLGLCVDTIEQSVEPTPMGDTTTATTATTTTTTPDHLLNGVTGHPPLLPGWNEVERATLRAIIAARQPFLDYVIRRVEADGSTRCFRVSGEPMFTQSCLFVGYRGVGVETAPPGPPRAPPPAPPAATSYPSFS
jgi:CheY-like chemotaxis protein